MAGGGLLAAKQPTAKGGSGDGCCPIGRLATAPCCRIKIAVVAAVLEAKWTDVHQASIWARSCTPDCALHGYFPFQWPPLKVILVSARASNSALRDVVAPRSKGRVEAYFR